MTKVGYSATEARASVQDCVDRARLEVLARGSNPALELC